MNVREKIGEVKDVLLRALDGWTGEMVDMMGESNSNVRNISVYLKRGVHNMLHEKTEEVEEMLNNVALFIVDENGEYNLPKFVDDMTEVVKTMDETPWNIGIISGTLGKGKLRVHIPDNILTRLIFGETGAVCFSADDIAKMRRWMEA